MLGFDLVPFLSQEEIADIPVLDPVSAHIELIERNNVLREVVADRVIRTKLTVDRFVGGEQIALSHFAAWRGNVLFRKISRAEAHRVHSIVLCFLIYFFAQE